MDSMIRDIPRIYTALAEWSACITTVILLRNHRKGWKLVLTALCALVVQIVFLIVTANFTSDILWLTSMFLAVMIMYAFIRITCKGPSMDCAYHCARNFILAEFMASFEWQIYCFFWENGKADWWMQLLLLAVTYGIICFVMVQLDKRHLPESKEMNINRRELTSTIIIVLGVFLISNLSFVSTHTPFSGLYDNEIMNIRTVVDFGGIAVLYAYFVQRSELRMRRELEAMQNIIKNHYQQYQMSKESIDLINRKYHDFKHQIAAIRAETDSEKRNLYLDEMESDIKNYEAQNKTGNHVLDTLLTSKSLYCARKHITLTSVVDGKLLSFMYTMDLCSIFGNALDNAIECEERIQDESKRLIHLSVATQKGFVLIRVENYFEGELTFKDGLPVTKKMDQNMHGFGMKSMRLAAQKYGGTLTADVSNNWFELRILIPIPKELPKA